MSFYATLGINGPSLKCLYLLFKVSFANIIGVLKGERFGQADDKILGVAAHYDTMPYTPGKCLVYSKTNERIYFIVSQPVSQS